MAETVSPREAQTTTAASAEPLGQLGRHGLKRRQASLWGDAWRRLRKNKLALAGLFVVVMLSLTAIFAPILAREPIDAQNYTFRSTPGRVGHTRWVPTNSAATFSAGSIGVRASRCWWGIVAQVIVLVIGVPIGALAGFLAVGRTSDPDALCGCHVCLPNAPIRRALSMSMFGRGLDKIFLVIGLTSWVALLAGLVRAQFLTLREKDYVVAARSIGASNLRLIIKHMLPNALTPIIVALTFGVPECHLY